jgi:hypothetical protein
MDFEDVGRQPPDNFAGISQINFSQCFEKECYAYILMHCVFAVLLF